jgi:uncharacterized protein YpbB
MRNSVISKQLSDKMKNQSLEDQLTPSQRKTWAIIKRGFEELKLIEAGNMKARPIKELLDELEREEY